MKIVLYVNPVLNPLAALLSKLDGVETVTCDDSAALARALPEAEALVLSNSTYTDPVAKIVAEHGRELDWIQFTSIGVDQFERFDAPRRITVCNAAGLRSGAVAEHALALLLALSRRLQPVEQARGARDWAALGAAAGGTRLLFGQTLLCLGYGGVGKEVARLAKAFGMRVVACNRSGAGEGPADEVIPLAAFRDRLSEAHAVVLCLPASAETAGLLGSEEFARLREGALLVNVGRGELVEATAMIEALDSGRLGAAALDVFDPEPLPEDHPFWDQPDILITPHVAGNGGDPVSQLRDLMDEGLKRMRAGGAPLNVVRAGTPDA